MLVNCAAYEHGKKLDDIPPEAISDYLRRPDCFVWVALMDATPLELNEMQQEFNLHELAVEDARHGHQRPKIEEYDDSLFSVLHIVELIDDRISLGEMNIFTGPNYVLSIRNRTQQSFRGVRDRCEREPRLLEQGSSFVLYALMDEVVDRYFPVLDAIETELEQVEEQIFGSSAALGNIQRLYHLKQKTIALKHAVLPLMEAMGKLYGGRVPDMCLKTENYFRDVHDHLYRINLAIDSIRDTISTAMQANISLVAIEESVVTKRLAAWAAIFAVATAFFGIWGMNFDYMPELRLKYGYAIALGTVAGVCALLYSRFRKSGWL